MTNQEAPVSIEKVLEEFDGKRDLLEKCCEKTKNLIEECLIDANIRYQSVQARVKRRKKLREKYTNPEKNYKRLDDITDLAAFRIITYYEDEVDAVAEVIRREFELDPANCVDRRTSDPDRFSYHAINYVCFHLPERLKSVEYKRFSSQRFEIQITSILRHAWSEIEHDWYDLKDAFPREIKRRFYRMAALLEVAESEFLELRNKKNNYQRSVAVQMEANVPGIPLDRVSIRSFLEQDELATKIDQSVAVRHGATGALVPATDDYLNRIVRITSRLDLKTVEELRELLKRYESAIVEFADSYSRILGKFSSGSAIMQGGGTMYLCLILVAKSGPLELKEVFGDNLDKAEVISELAREVAAKL